MTETSDLPFEFDAEAVHAKYKGERDKRMSAGRAAIRDLTRDEVFAEYLADPFTSVVSRDSLSEDVDVAIVGSGMAGVVVGAQLRKIGMKQIRLIDRTGGLGGTWYWNRYPGVMCDVESYCYMPMLEEMGYIRKTDMHSGRKSGRSSRPSPPSSIWSIRRCSTPASRRASGTNLWAVG
jgi:NAD(P)-binding Rossmann-like domain